MFSPPRKARWASTAYLVPRRGSKFSPPRKTRWASTDLAEEFCQLVFSPPRKTRWASTCTIDGSYAAQFSPPRKTRWASTLRFVIAGAVLFSPPRKNEVGFHLSAISDCPACIFPPATMKKLTAAVVPMPLRDWFSSSTALAGIEGQARTGSHQRHSSRQAAPEAAIASLPPSLVPR